LKGSTDRSDAHFMRLALDQARKAASAGQMPFGGVVLDSRGRLVGKGHNTVRAKKDPSSHGEVVAIRDAWRHVGEWQKLIGGTLYSSCEPCLLCSFIITQVGIRRVVFAARGTDVPTYRPLLDTDFTKVAAWVNSRPDWPSVEVVGDFMRDDALKIIAAFPWGDDYARSSGKRI
jgi:tRNA(Arg) A34 adenosine deaminase TadA